MRLGKSAPAAAGAGQFYAWAEVERQGSRYAVPLMSGEQMRTFSTSADALAAVMPIGSVINGGKVANRSAMPVPEGETERQLLAQALRGGHIPN